MRRIPLTQGKFALVDDADFDRVNQFKWHANFRNGTWYASTGKRGPTLHRLLAGVSGFLVDHINGNGLDNRRDNLLVATRSQNNFNQRPKFGKSGYRGATRITGRGQLWQARLSVESRRIYLGCFGNPEAAYGAWLMAAFLIHGRLPYALQTL